LPEESPVVEVAAAAVEPIQNILPSLPLLAVSVTGPQYSARLKVIMLLAGIAALVEGDKGTTRGLAEE